VIFAVAALGVPDAISAADSCVEEVGCAPQHRRASSRVRRVLRTGARALTFAARMFMNSAPANRVATMPASAG
jgi:hypothetical protein